MTILTLIGWAVVHSLWQATLIAGLASISLSLLPDCRARTRCVIAYAALMLMVVAPVATAMSRVDLLTRGTRMTLMRAMDAAVTLPVVVRGRALVVPAAAAIWIVGVAIGAMRVAIAWRRAQALRRRDVTAADASTRDLLGLLQRQLHIGEPLDLRRSTRAQVPMVIGWRRPIILLPRDTAAALDAPQLRAVLAHELGHVRRRDYLTNLIQAAAETVLFHHPGAQWVSRRIRTEREYCCDDIAVAVGSDPRQYAHALAALEDARAIATSGRDDCRLAVAAASGTLLDRIQRLVGAPRRVLTPARALALLVVTAVVASLIAALAMIVPPSLPLDAKLRSRGPAPIGAAMAPPDAGALRSKRQQ